MDRRYFLGLTAAGLAAPISSFCRGPIDRVGEPRLRLSLSAYSFRPHFAWYKGKRRTVRGRRMDMGSFIEYCGEEGCDGAELTAYFLPPQSERLYFNELKRQAFFSGVSICGTAIGNNFSLPKGPELSAQISQAKDWIDAAAMIGAPHIRFFAGKDTEFQLGRDRIDNAIAALQECAEYAGQKGIVIGVENHGSITPELLLEIVHAVESPWLGVNLDTGNFLSDSPYRDLETCAPYAVNVQVKIHVQTPEREKRPADIERIIGILKAAKYQGYVVLEYEDDRPFEEVPSYLARMARAIERA